MTLEEKEMDGQIKKFLKIRVLIETSLNSEFNLISTPNFRVSSKYKPCDSLSKLMVVVGNIISHTVFLCLVSQL
jgi:hypothetical protein